MIKWKEIIIKVKLIWFITKSNFTVPLIQMSTVCLICLWEYWLSQCSLVSRIYLYLVEMITDIEGGKQNARVYNACVLIYMEIDISSHKTSLMNNVKIRISLFVVFISLNNIVYVLLKIWLSHCIWVFCLPVRLPCMEVSLEARKRCEIICNYSYR